MVPVQHRHVGRGPRTREHTCDRSQASLAHIPVPVVAPPDPPGAQRCEPRPEDVEHAPEAAIRVVGVVGTDG